MESIFSKIAKGEIPSYKVAENDSFYAFLDINPLTRGHTLVIPKEETDYFFDIDDHTMSDMMLFAKKVALAIGQATSCKRVGLVVLGFDVPHAHIHLVPMQGMQDIDFKRDRVKLSQEEFQIIANNIAEKLR